MFLNVLWQDNLAKILFIHKTEENESEERAEPKVNSYTLTTGNMSESERI